MEISLRARLSRAEVIGRVSLPKRDKLLHLEEEIADENYIVNIFQRNWLIAESANAHCGRSAVSFLIQTPFRVAAK